MAVQSDENKRSALKAWMRALERTAPIERTPTRTLPVVMDELAARWRDAPALNSPEGTLTYQALASTSQAYARWALREGLKSGDVVALLMENCPQYLAIWLGLTRIGLTVALLNTNLAGAALAHAINTAGSSYVISSARLAPLVLGVRAGRNQLL